MRQLIWKEWRELRLLPLAATLCVALLAIMAKAYYGAYDYRHPLQIADLLLLSLVTWGLFSLITSSGLFAQEVGGGTLTFLSALPVSRRRVWGVKVGVATAVLMLALLASGVTLTLLAPLLVPGTTATALWGPLLTPREFPFNVLILLDIFAVSLTVSPLLDRPLSVVIAAALASIVCYGVVAFFTMLCMSVHMQLYTDHLGPYIGQHRVLIPARLDFNRLIDISAASPTPALLAVSYWTFTRGETLRSAKRFRVGALAGAVSVAVAGLMFWAGAWAQWW